MSRHAKFAKVTWWQVDAAGLLLCGLLTVTAYATVVRPVARQQMTVVRLRGEIAESRREIAATEQAIHSLNQELMAVHDRIAASPVRLEPIHKLNRRIAELVALAEANDMLIHESGTGMVESGVRYDTVPVQLTGSGSYPGCARFLRALREELPDVSVRGFDFTGQPERPGSPSIFVFNLAWYAAPGGPDARGAPSERAGRGDTMKLSRNQKRYAGVLGVCLLALLADRFILSAPGSADAGESRPAPVAATPAIAPAGDPATATVPGRARAVSSRSALALRMDQIGTTLGLDPHRMHDPFVAPDAWLPDRMTPEHNPMTETEVDRFLRGHQLTAVMANGARGFAIVDGERVVVGDEIDGFTVISMHSRSIRLRAGDLEIEMNLGDR